MPQPDLDTDRIAVSSELFDLADRFAVEATMWAEASSKANLARGARHLAQLARGVLTVGDIEVARAYADAGRTLMGNIEGARRFLLCLDTPPMIRRHRRAQP